MESLFQVLFWASLPLVFLYFMYTTFLALLPPVTRYKSKKQTLSEPLHYVFCIPCLNEERVIANTVRSILRLPHPNITVIVIDDHSNDETVNRVREIGDSRVRIIERKLPNARLGKGHSLNYAYQRISKAVRRLGVQPSQVIIGIIDGDGRPSMNLLEETSVAFTDPTIGAAQARIRMTNRKQILPFLQDMEFFTMVTAIQNSREYAQSVGLGGNGQFSRLSAMQEFGDEPWTDCLLEDFDFGLRLTLNGWKIRHLQNGIVYQQGLTSIKRFIRQRSRWVQGNIQSVHYRKPLIQSSLSKGAKLDIMYFLAQPWMNLTGSMLMFLSWIFLTNKLLFTSDFQFLMSNNPTWMNATSILIWLLLIYGPSLTWSLIHYSMINKEEPLWKCLGAGLLLPLYNLLVIPSIWMAFYRQIKGKNGWIKTERIEESSS